MDYDVIISLVAEIVEYCIPFSLIFGITAKLYRLVMDFVFNRRVEM